MQTHTGRLTDLLHLIARDVPGDDRVFVLDRDPDSIETFVPRSLERSAEAADLPEPHLPP